MEIKNEDTSMQAFMLGVFWAALATTPMIKTFSWTPSLDFSASSIRFEESGETFLVQVTRLGITEPTIAQ